jgi:regulator of nonsense transcripts 1
MQGLSQTFREGFSMGGMSQVLNSSSSGTQFSLNLFHFQPSTQISLVFFEQDFFGEDFKSQGSNVPYNIADFSTQVNFF